MKRPTLTPLVSLLALLISIGTHAQPADLVIQNARIWSDGRDDLAPFAAIRDGRFVHVGQRDDSLIGPDTTILDAAGRVVIPGLIDTHVHLLSGGASLSAIQL
ncbi:MAG: amidohydrolase, partial [Planctomycetes bacterium]|nr:amidohydrolase [Planctomycetota bacterium]